MRLREMFHLNGKVALVTGGGKGIGKFIATGLAEAGANVVLTSRNRKNLEATAHELESNFNIKALPVAGDLEDPDDIDSIFKTAMNRFSRIDILVNSASSNWVAPTLNFPLAYWDKLFNVNVRGVWILTQSVANIMKRQGGGNIINVSSIMGFRGSSEETHPSVPYNSTKAAINILTMNLAVKLAPYKIRVNAIAPGFFHTDMMTSPDKPEIKDTHVAPVAQIPMGRLGEENDIKGIAVFLASDVSAYMTGHVMVVDGGISAK